MDSNKFWVLVLLLWCTSVRDIVESQPNVFRVTDFGAIADGETDSSKALLDAWGRACGTDGGVVTIPVGVFFVSGANLVGPCKGRTFFELKGTLVASAHSSFDPDFWIQFRQIDGLTILGRGTFDGNGQVSWARSKGKCKSGCERPMSIKVIKVTNSVIQDVKSVNSKKFHFHIARCSNLLVNNVDIRAPDHSPNTDGIHTGNSDNIRITNSRISTGDDCISIGDGTRNINISRIICGPGHGISIGSLGKYKNEESISGVIVTDSTIIEADNGLRIKTMAPSALPLSISDVTFANIRMNNVENPIIIDQYYCPSSSCSHSQESDVEIRDVRFINIRGTSETEVGVKAYCSKARPCKGLVFSGLDLKFHQTGQPTTCQSSNCDHRFVGPAPQVPSRCS